MSNQPIVPGFRRGGLYFLALLCCLGIQPHVARAISLPSTALVPVEHGRISFVLPALSWQDFLAPVEYVLGSRRRMVQIAIVVGCILIYILMRRLA